MTLANQNPALAALQWHLEHGADEALADAPVDRTAVRAVAAEAVPLQTPDQPFASMPAHASAPPSGGPAVADSSAMMGSAAAKVEAVKLARACTTLEELRDAIAGFDGLAIRKTATNMVFGDGLPGAPVMLIGEAPGADEDRQGKPFVGVSGQLLDRILACIGLDRKAEDPAQAVYISNILNWRPPGNRTPAPAEIEIALPFIERHIALARPRFLILCGGVSAKALLDRSEGISRLRGTLHDYRPLTPDIAAGVAEDAPPVRALATYHPAYLLRTPAQKRAVWADMLLLQQHIRDR